MTEIEKTLIIIIIFGTGSKILKALCKLVELSTKKIEQKMFEDYREWRQGKHYNTGIKAIDEEKGDNDGN